MPRFLSPRSLAATALLALSLVTACGETLTFGARDTDPGDPVPGPGNPGATHDPMLPGPPPTGCGDVVTNADNCGFCGHSCRGAACEKGLCTPEVVASAPRLSSFVTSGMEVFYIDGRGAFRCEIGSNKPCAELVAIGALVQRGWSPIQHGWLDLVDRRPLDLAPGVSLAPTGIALLGEKVFVTDQTTRAILVCPTNARCDANSVGIVQADASGLALQSAVAAGPTSITWAQGAGLFGAAVPAPGTKTTPSVRRFQNDTAQTERLAAPDLADVTWLSGSGLYHSGGLQQTSSRLYPIGATDFAADPIGVFVATPTGLARVTRADQVLSVVAPGAFRAVASDDRGVVATKTTEAGETIVKVVAGADPLPLASLAGVGDVTNLVVTGDYVFYGTTANGTGTVFRVAR